MKKYLSRSCWCGLPEKRRACDQAQSCQYLCAFSLGLAIPHPHPLKTLFNYMTGNYTSALLLSKTGGWRVSEFSSQKLALDPFVVGRTPRPPPSPPPITTPISGSHDRIPIFPHTTFPQRKPFALGTQERDNFVIEWTQEENVGL